MMDALTIMIRLFFCYAVASGWELIFKDFLK